MKSDDRPGFVDDLVHVPARTVMSVYRYAVKDVLEKRKIIDRKCNNMNVPSLSYQTTDDMRTDESR